LFKISLLEGIKNIDKNKTLTYLTVLLFAFLFLLQGFTLSYYYVSELRNKASENESFSNYETYVFSMTMDLMDTYLETYYKDEIQRETIEFVETLNNIEHLKFITEFNTGFPINGFKGDPEVFAEDFDDYDPDSGYVKVNALVVSPQFRESESYRVIKGRDFTADDMVYVEGRPMPVLLGYKYYDLGVYEIGDRFSLAYKHMLYGDFVQEFEVIGFLEEDNTIVERAGITVWDMDTFVIAPGIEMTWDRYSQYDEEFRRYHRYAIQNSEFMIALFKSKMYIASDHVEEVLSEVQTALNEYCGVSKCVKLGNSGQASLKNQSRLESFSEFSAATTGVLMFFAVVTVLISITNRVSRNMKDYAIHITVGATLGNTVLFIVAEMAIILTCSMILGLIATKWMMYYINMPFYFWRFLGVYVLTSVVILALSAIVARIAMRKYDICTLIK